MQRNRGLALSARTMLSVQLGWNLLAPDSMIGSMAAIEMPDSTAPAPLTTPLYSDPYQDTLWKEHQVEVPIVPWPAPPKRLIRISAQLYNQTENYIRLISALKASFH